MEKNNNFKKNKKIKKINNKCKQHTKTTQKHPTKKGINYKKNNVASAKGVGVNAKA